MATATTPRKVKKFLTLGDLEAKTTGSVYVLNQTEGETEARVLITIPKMNGNGVDLCRIPKTFNPVDLTMEVPRAQLLASSEFRKTLGRGHIKLITEEYALLLLSSPEAKAETKRLQDEAHKARNLALAAGASKVMKEENSDEEDEEEYIDVDDVSAIKAAQKKSVKKKAPARPAPKVEQLARNALDQGTKTVDLIGQMRNIRSMTRADLAYLSKQFEDKPKIIAHLKERLQAIKEKEQEEE